MQVLGVQIRDEIIGDSCLFTSRYIKFVSRSRQVPHYSGPGREFRGQWLWLQESAGHKCDLNWLRLMIGKIEQCLSRSPIYKLDPKDLSLRESHVDVDRELWGSRGLGLSLGDEGELFVVRNSHSGRELTASAAAKTPKARRAKRVRADTLRETIVGGIVERDDG